MIRRIGLELENNWKFGFIPNGFDSKEKAMKTLARLGYKGIEFLWGFGERSDILSAEDLMLASKRCSTHGLKITDIHCGEDFVTLDDNIRKERTKLVQAKIEVVKEAGIDMINQFTGPAYWNETPLKLGREIKEGRAWSGVIESFNEIISTAEKNSVYVSVEACSGMLCSDYYSIKELLDRISSKYLVVTMDPSWYELAQNDVGWVIHRLGDKIRHVHLKDSIGVPGVELRDYMFPMLGEGMVDWREFFRALKDIGYDKFLSVEFETTNYFTNVLSRNGSQAAEISMAQLEKLTTM